MFHKLIKSRMLLLVPLMLLAFALSFMQTASVNAQTGFVQIFGDEFSGAANTGVNTTNWLYDTGICYPGCPATNWGTGEVESMTTSTANVYQDGSGHLVIKPIRDASGNWTSGRIETNRSDFAAPAGGVLRIEGSLQQPNVSDAAAAGYWPAFWSLGEAFRPGFTNWPGAGEIDIMEDINGLSSEFGTLHCGVAPGGPCNENTGLGSGQHACAGCQTAYHQYAIEYDRSVSPEQIRWYLDGVNYFTLNASQVSDATAWNNATHHGFFVILNVAIGGAFPAAFGGGPTASTTSGVPMLVDYVHVLTKAGSGATNTPVPTNTPVGPTATPTKTNTPGGPTATQPAGDFTQGVTFLNSAQAQIWIKPTTAAAYVDVHYLVNGAGQQNFRMTNNAGTWQQTVSGLSAGNVLTYWFTYEKSGAQYDSAHFTYTQGGSSPTNTPTRTNTPGVTFVPPTNTSAPGSPTLYVRSGAALNTSAGSNAGSVTIASAGGANHDGTVTNPQTFTISGLNMAYSSGNTNFDLFLDSATAVGNGIQVKVSYDFTGNGTWDRTETYHYFATDAIAGNEDYNQSSFGGLATSSGAYSNLVNGKVKIEVWSAIGTGSTTVRIDATSAQGQQSKIVIPFH